MFKQSTAASAGRILRVTLNGNTTLDAIYSAPRLLREDNSELLIKTLRQVVLETGETLRVQVQRPNGRLDRDSLRHNAHCFQVSYDGASGWWKERDLIHQLSLRIKAIVLPTHTAEHVQTSAFVRRFDWTNPRSEPGIDPRRSFAGSPLKRSSPLEGRLKKVFNDYIFLRESSARPINKECARESEICSLNKKVARARRRSLFSVRYLSSSSRNEERIAAGRRVLFNYLMSQSRHSRGTDSPITPHAPPAPAALCDAIRGVSYRQRVTVTMRPPILYYICNY
ncbi:hypothetical protein EVAR_97482_1 [Eumeta japonica]|uniref:Uncharacterized protein n=1 Tax=Eumeta variegata TaxID=151549 RepID=A0A4C1Z9I1_EUMVA|nr:hypothetical protein EVAR_97482_1 [Eumeta japonica]